MGGGDGTTRERKKKASELRLLRLGAVTQKRQFRRFAARFTRLPGGGDVASRLYSKSLQAVFVLRFATVRIY